MGVLDSTKPKETIEHRLNQRLVAIFRDFRNVSKEIRDNADFILNNTQDKGEKGLKGFKMADHSRHHYFAAMSAASFLVDGTRQHPPETQAILINTFHKAVVIIAGAFSEYSIKNQSNDPKVVELYKELSTIVKNASNSTEVGLRDAAYLNQDKGGDATVRENETGLHVQNSLTGGLRPKYERERYNPQALERSVAQAAALFERINRIAINSLPPTSVKSVATLWKLEDAYDKQSAVLRAVMLAAQTLSAYMAAVDVRGIPGEKPENTKQRTATEKQKRTKEQENIAKNSVGFIAQMVQAVNRIYGVRVMPPADNPSDNSL